MEGVWRRCTLVDMETLADFFRDFFGGTPNEIDAPIAAVNSEVREIHVVSVAEQHDALRVRGLDQLPDGAEFKAAPTLVLVVGIKKKRDEFRLRAIEIGSSTSRPRRANSASYQSS